MSRKNDTHRNPSHGEGSAPGGSNAEDQQITDLSLFIAALSVRFRPARSPRDTTHWFSTQEVCAAIRDIDPSAKVGPTQVFNALRNAGYDFCNRPSSQGLQFRWMFHEKTIQ